jgi:hypothetical protein
MVDAALHPTYKTCAECPITSRERIEALLVKACSNFPFFSYRFWFEYQRQETSVPQKHTLFSTFTPLSPSGIKIYCTESRYLFLQEEKFFIETDDFDHVSGLQYEDNFFSYLLPTNFQAFMFTQCSPSNLLALRCLCVFILEESLFA